MREEHEGRGDRLPCAGARVAALLLGALVGIGACKSSTDVATDAACVGDPAPEHRSFDPTTYDRSCTTDSDCVVVKPVTPGAGSTCELPCCGSVGVRGSDAVSAEVARLSAACCLFEECTLGCSFRAACVKGSCAAVRTDVGTDLDGAASSDAAPE